MTGSSRAAVVAWIVCAAFAVWPLVHERVQHALGGSETDASMLRAPALLQGPVQEGCSVRPIRGEMHDCQCKFEEVDEANEKHIYPILHDLSHRTYFRFFRANLRRPCPLWVENELCRRSTCGVCECSDEEIPYPWREQARNEIDRDLSANRGNCSLLVVDDGSDAEYVDLVRNPESNTGFSGPEATRIWSTIYKENCFKGSLQDMCFEERVYFRIISGMHTSITVHVAEYFFNQKWPHLEMFRHAVAKFPDRIENLYFVFLLMLRAVGRASAFFESHDFNTGNPVEDLQVKGLVQNLMHSPLFRHCASSFDDSIMFREGTKKELLDEFRKNFANVSQIMDCVACQKCRLHGKVQVLGIGAALRILLSDSADEAVQSLTRNEIAALFNSLYKFANSIHILSLMVDRDNGWKFFDLQIPRSQGVQALRWSAGFYVMYAVYLFLVKRAVRLLRRKFASGKAKSK